MTYVEAMVEKIKQEPYADVINQIIADTKMACRMEILGEIDVPYTVKQAYLIAIVDALVKEQ